MEEVTEKGYKKIKFLTKEKLINAKKINKYEIPEETEKLLTNFQNLEVLAIKISVNSPVVVEDICSISNLDKINAFTKEIENQ